MGLQTTPEGASKAQVLEPTIPPLHFQEHVAEPGGAAAPLSQCSSLAGPPPRTALVMHCATGSSADYAGLAAGLAARAAGCTGARWRVLAVDLRHHGRSGSLGAPRPPWPAPSTVTTGAGDLIRLIDIALGGQTPDIVVAHSLGGKVALELLRLLAEGGRPAPQQVWVVDATAGSMPFEQPFYKRNAGFLATLESVPLPLASEAAFLQLAEERQLLEDFKCWMRTRLVPAGPEPGAGLAWSFDAAGVGSMARSQLATDCWPVVEAPPEGAELHVVRCLSSPVWQGAEAELEATAELASRAGSMMRLHELPECKSGHFHPIYEPELLLGAMAPALQARFGRLGGAEA